MRKIILASFISLDGIIQAPGGPDEDRSGGFNKGGWLVHNSDPIINDNLAAIMQEPFDLLLGRRTYEIFASHWPYMPDDDPIAQKFNRITKYVAATQPLQPYWDNTVHLKGDIVEELKNIRGEEGPNLLIHGSSGLVQTLLANDLIDVLHLMTFPVMLGMGKRLFHDGINAKKWRMVNSKIGANGVIVHSYEPAGEIITGSFAIPNPSAAELERRKRFENE